MWIKSLASGGGDCVEIETDLNLIRDSKNPNNGCLYGATVLIASIRNGY